MSTPLKLPISGAELQKTVFRMLLAALPDLHIRTEDRLADGGKIVYRNVVTGTHQGTYLGVEPTGKKIIVDTAAQMRQFGIIP
ncbi:putative ester cyclase [Catenulispora sp. GP43]|uniref:ester cyclase n=1 Tax=Catenulispora sp. GP43 TaxID=3156263 RepID=UPI003511E55C